LFSPDQGSKQSDQKVIIQAKPGGPLLLHGAFVLQNHDENESMHDKAALCRCGASANKPFCDGSHSRIEFIK